MHSSVHGGALSLWFINIRTFFQKNLPDHQVLRACGSHNSLETITPTLNVTKMLSFMNIISEMQFTVLNTFLFCTVIKYNDQRQKVNILAYSPSDTECITIRKAWHDSRSWKQKQLISSTHRKHRVRVSRKCNKALHPYTLKVHAQWRTSFCFS